VEKARIVLDPETPMFIFSLLMKNRPESRKVADAVSMRTEGSEVHITISDEKYAPEILSVLWKMYGRDRVDQQTRFDIKIEGADEDVIANTVIASGEDAKKEMIGAMWRVMPEGIKARYNISEGRLITIAATEEIVTDALKERAMGIHIETRGDVNV
jgi:putative methanogenesis marker protein 17